jgi:hypothetical protein
LQPCDATATASVEIFISRNGDLEELWRGVDPAYRAFLGGVAEDLREAVPRVLMIIVPS